MGLLDNTTQRAYYQGNDQGNYQFVSLEDIINQFIVTYVGEEKIISKAKRTDIAFHAQRALAELSFDTFKSIKSQEIELPPSLTMMLPQDYVNYTKVCWSDSNGIKRPLYPTRHTSNPFNILQNTDGTYEFTPHWELLQNHSFATGDLSSWFKVNISSYNTPVATAVNRIYVDNDRLTFSTGPSLTNVETNPSKPDPGKALNTWGTILAVWQPIDVSNVLELNISATGESAAGIYNSGSSGTISDSGRVWFGVSSTEPTPFTHPDPSHNKPSFSVTPPDIGNIEWYDGDDVASEKSLSVDVSNFSTVWILISSYTKFNDLTYDSTTDAMLGFSNKTLTNGTIKYNYYYDGNVATNYIGEISVTSESNEELVVSGSDTWTKYSTNTSNSASDATDATDATDVRDTNIGQRYGIEPSHAQSNGSFYIDDLRGLIHFSSNISGKTVVLDYISDSLGTDGEMQVHKFAEEAMYKWISHAILSTRINTPEYIVQRYKKERFAAIRQAKLRLSNLNIEELTQIMRGKSKWIKH
jgi:hypothetical protein